jgi:K+-transporting ATPase ATPase A chain
VAIACLHPATGASLANPLPHGFSELLYAFSSAANNNGSAFAGFAADTVFFNTALGLAMLCGRFWPMLAVIAVAGALARKKGLPVSAGTLATDTPLFTGLLIGTVLVVGALTFLPALAAGPIIEQLLMSR